MPGPLARVFRVFDGTGEEGYYRGNAPEGVLKLPNFKDMITSITNYFKDVRAEMKHVSWPSRKLTIAYTVVVVILSLATAVYLGLLDYGFSALIKQII